MKHLICIVLYFFFLYSIFLFSDIWPSNDYIYIDVYDEDAGKKPDFIGAAKISLDTVIEKGHYDDWVRLPGRFGFGSNGDIRVRMTFEKSSTD